MKRRCAVLAKVKSEALFLERFWLPHYSQFFEPRDLHVHSDGSLDATNDLCTQAGVSLTVVAPGAVEFGKNNVYIVNIIARLLEDYDCVLFGESPDDVIVPGPQHACDLGKYVDDFVQNSVDPYRFLTCYNVTHNTLTEPAFDPARGKLLAQRSTFIRCPQFDNSFLWKVVPTWGRGWHDLVGVNGGKRIMGGGDQQGDAKRLYNFHIHYADFDLCNARHHVRQATYSAQELQNGLYSCQIDNELCGMMTKMISSPATYFAGARIDPPPPWMRSIV